jgi:isopenicillin N synthase-like dioxygenase
MGAASRSPHAADPSGVGDGLVPTVDLSALSKEGPSRGGAAHAVLDQACRRVGFFQLVNHKFAEQ